jgi:hypothetical protein
MGMSDRREGGFVGMDIHCARYRKKIKRKKTLFPSPLWGLFPNIILILFCPLQAVAQSRAGLR